jgi:tRNA (guanine37-N1)-methyltransferase
MHIQILTIFPALFSGFLGSSLIRKAIDRGQLQISLIDIRDFAEPPHFKVDDLPYGGGAGMVMRAEPLAKATLFAKSQTPQESIVVLLSASGTPFTQPMAQDFSQRAALILICGRYEGVDQRFIESYVDSEISIGPYVLMGGEVAAMVLIEASSRLIPGVLGNQDSLKEESFGAIELEYPHYTRPPEFEGRAVPEVLLSGDHAKIAAWRKKSTRKHE